MSGSRKVVWLLWLLLPLAALAEQTDQLGLNKEIVTNAAYQMAAESRDLTIPMTHGNKDGSVTFTEPALCVEITHLTTRDFVKWENQEVRPEELAYDPDIPWVPDLAGKASFNFGLRAIDTGEEWLLFSLDPSKTKIPNHFVFRVYHLTKKHSWDSFTIRYRTVFYRPNQQAEFSEERSVKITLVDQPFLQQVFKARIERAEPRPTPSR